VGLKPEYRLVANSEDVTATIAERFRHLTLTDESGVASDMLEIVLADHLPEQPIEIPETGSELELFLGYDGKTERMGLYVVDEIELAGWPGEMTIRARAAVYDGTPAGKADLQTQKTRTWAKGTTIGAMVGKIAKEHGMEPAVTPELAKVVLPQQDQTDESDLNFLLRVARKYDAISKPAGGLLVFAKRGQSKTASGQDIPPVKLPASECARWRMTTSTRETAGQIVAYHHAVAKAKRQVVKVGKGEPVRRLKGYYPTAEMALAAARAELKRRERGAVTLAMTATGRTDLMAEGALTLEGFRPGLPAEWIVTRVVHRLDAQTGYRCDIEAEQPDDGTEPEVEIQQGNASDSGRTDFEL